MDRMGSVMAGGGPGSERGEVTAGYLARSERTSGGHWDTGGGVGEPRGGVTGGWAEGGGGGGVVAKTGSGFCWGKITLDALQSTEMP